MSRHRVDLLEQRARGGKVELFYAPHATALSARTCPGMVHLPSLTAVITVYYFAVIITTRLHAAVRALP